MRKIKIVADSSANLMSLGGHSFECAPLKVITKEREFVDVQGLDVGEMLSYLASYKGQSKSSCPNTGDWLAAFGDAEEVFCVTITSGLSGSFNAANAAKRIYEEEHSGRHVFVLDSLSAGPEVQLMVEKLGEYVAAGMEFDEICKSITEYREKTSILFMLKSLRNFANNGRISPIIAKLIGLAGICILCCASAEGTIEQVDKCRGERAALIKLRDKIIAEGLKAGRVIISHCENEAGAVRLRDMLKEALPEVRIDVNECLGLCSFYAERGGLLVGFERL